MIEAAGDFGTTKLGEYYQRVAGAGGNRFIAASRAKRTWEQYASVVKLFGEWCVARDLSPLPARTDTILTWVLWLADQGRTWSTIKAYLDAISTYHRLAGYSVDRRPLSETLRGIKRMSDQVRRAKPLLAADLQGILAMLSPDQPGDARDGALLAVGWAAALRRIELTGLDWRRRTLNRTRGTGLLRMDENGVSVELIRSKGSQESSVFIDIPLSDMPAAHYWLTAWKGIADLQPGQPVFRMVSREAGISLRRLGDKSVARIVRKRVMALEQARGLPRDEAFAQADGYTGHSLRAGYATSAARAGVHEWRIRERMRHKSANQVAAYIRAQETRQENGLSGLGF